MAGWLPADWEPVSLGDVADIQDGIPPRAKRRPRDYRFPCLRAADVDRPYFDLEGENDAELLDDGLERCVLADGDLLVVKEDGGRERLERAVLRRGQSSDCLCRNHRIRVRPTARLDPAFLQYLWNSGAVTAQIAHAATPTGAGARNMRAADLRRIAIPLPPLQEQRRIVAALEEHLPRLDAALRRVTLATRQARLLVRRIITDAVPIPGPEHWDLMTVADVGSVDLGRKRHPKWHTGTTMRPYLRVANVFEDRIDTSDLAEMHFPEDVFDRFRLRSGDILLNEGQSLKHLGRPAMYRGEPESVAFTNSLLRFAPDEGVDSEWALLVFRRHLHSGRFMRAARMTTNLAHLSVGRFKSVEFPVPPLVEQRCIAAFVRERLAVLAQLDIALAAASQDSDALRDALLDQALGGRLTAQHSWDGRVESSYALKPAPPSTSKPAKTSWIQEELPL